jgi:hypothetical protein
MAMSFRFPLSEPTGVVAALEVHEPDGNASLEQLYAVLLAMRLQLVSASELDVEGRVVFELSICELDGARVKPARRGAILADLAQRIAATDGGAPTAAPPTKPLRAA